MARPIRVEFPGALYHVMSRGVGGMATFQDDIDRARFLDGIGALVETGVLIVHAFCLMTNHFHLLCETPLGKLGRWMQMLLSRFSRDFNRHHSRIGHLWQARYKAILVEPGEHFLDCSRYIHLNPVRAAMVRCAEEHVWSSYRNHLRLDSVVEWVSCERLQAEAGGLHQYRKFVEYGLTIDERSPFDRAVAGAFFGNEQFVQRMRALVRKPRRLADLSRFNSLNRLQPLPIERLRMNVDAAFSDCSQCKRTRILAFVLRRFSLMTGREIAEAIGRSEAAVSLTCRDLEEKMAVDPGWANRINGLFQMISRDW
jgi:putative transposase